MSVCRYTASRKLVSFRTFRYRRGGRQLARTYLYANTPIIIHYRFSINFFDDKEKIYLLKAYAFRRRLEKRVIPLSLLIDC